jgi:hypothetical protein
MEWIVGMMELTLLGNIAWIVLGLPLLLALGGVTLGASVRLRGTAQAGDDAAQPTPFARPARVLALSLVGLGCTLGTVVIGAVVIAAPEGAWGTAFGVAMTATMAFMNVLMAAFVVMLVLVARDVLRARFVAGRDTWFAYTVMIVAQAGVLVLAVATGIPGQLLGL